MLDEKYSPYKPDYSKTGKELLVDMINWGNRNTMMKVIDVKDIMFTKPIKQPRTEDCNTKIRIQSLVGYKGFENPVDIEYNRLDIRQLIAFFDFDGNVVIETAKEITNISDLLDDLYKVFPVKLLKEDIVDSPFSMMKPEGAKVRFVISDESIAYHGEFEVLVRYKDIRIDTAIRCTKFENSFKPYHFYSRS